MTLEVNSIINQMSSGLKYIRNEATYVHARALFIIYFIEVNSIINQMASGLKYIRNKAMYVHARALFIIYFRLLDSLDKC